MKLFACQACGQLLYFENVRCEHCGRTLGYLPDLGTMSSLEPKPDGGWTVLVVPERAYKFCDNARYGVCNWMLPDGGPDRYCTACRHNHVIRISPFPAMMRSGRGWKPRSIGFSTR